MTRETKWKKNFRGVPKFVTEAVGKLKSDLFVIAETKKIPFADIEAGDYRHVGLTMKDGAVSAREKPALPAASGGTWSNRNLYGWEKRLTDLPMITKTYSWETPNFGDGATYGYHTHETEREVYQVETFEPRAYGILVELLKIEDSTKTALVKFMVTAVFDRTDISDYDLQLAVNLLQENTGVCAVYERDAARDDYIAHMALDWEVFPPGTIDDMVAAILKGKKAPSEDKRGVVEARVRLFNSLKPKTILRGRGGLAAYIGAQFADDLVVFENLNHGNALYVLYANWEDVSKRSRVDILKGTSESYDRFVHKDGWEDRFKDHIARELAARPAPVKKR